MAKETITASAKYKRGALVIGRKDVQQNFDHLSPNLLPVELEVFEQGYLERDGKEYKFQVIRILMEHC